jgi:dihydroneopterin aldolase
MNGPALPVSVGCSRIFVEGLRLHAFHGHFAHERKHGQTFVIDLELAVDLGEAALADDLKATVDYGKVVEVAREVFCGPPRKLVEAAALDVARALLEKFARVESVVARVGKVAPPIAATLSAAGVEIEVKRGG